MSLFLKQYLTENISKILSWSEYSFKVLNLQTIVDWYLEPRQCTTFRVNTLRYNTEDLITNITEELKKKFNLDTNDLPSVTVNEIIPECITIGRLQESILDLTPSSKEVIVDVYCGAAVLRGSNVFAPGVMGMLPSISIGEKVSIYVDLSGKCLQGYKEIYKAEEKLFVGNGIALMNRSQLFGVAKQKRGVAIAVTNPSSGVVMFDHLFSMGILQNLPSMVCVRALDPKPGEVILDMCAAPGNKTTHIATLANDEATIVAIDRAVKIGTIIQNCINLSIQNVLAFKGDSTKLITEENDRRIQNGPPFSKNTFDKILADVPCSGSGQRPMLKILIKRESDIRSYAPLQKKFLRNAIYLLKPGGYIVYSTCSIYCEENECVIAWLLETYPEMELVSSAPLLGVPGLPECGLNEEQRQLVQRFGPGKKTAYDTIGFFIAKLRKTRDIEEPVWRK